MPLTIAAVVGVALGACALATAVMAPIAGVQPWVLAAGGTVLLVVSLVVLWIIQRRRDRTLW